MLFQHLSSAQLHKQLWVVRLILPFPKSVGTTTGLERPALLGTWVRRRGRNESAIKSLAGIDTGARSTVSYHPGTHENRAPREQRSEQRGFK